MNRSVRFVVHPSLVDVALEVGEEETTTVVVTIDVNGNAHVAYGSPDLTYSPQTPVTITDSTDPVSSHSGGQSNPEVTGLPSTGTHTSHPTKHLIFVGSLVLTAMILTGSKVPKGRRT